MRADRAVFLRIAAAPIALCLAAAPTLRSQPLIAGPETLILPGGHEGAGEFELALDSQGVFAGVWGIHGNMFFRVFGPDGATRGSLQKVPSGATERQIAAVGAGRFVVAWVGQDGTLAARVGDLAGAWGDPVILAYGARHVRIGASPDGGFVAAWLPTSVESPVRVRRFDTQGSPLGEELGVEAAGFSHLIPMAQGRFALIVDSRLQTYSAAGELEDVGPPASFVSDVEADAAGRLVSAWQGEDYHTVSAQRQSSAGQDEGPRIEIASTNGYLVTLARVATRPDGSFLVVWNETPGVSGGPGPYVFAGVVRAQAFEASGRPMAPPFTVHDMAQSHELLADVAGSSAGWLVSWERWDSHSIFVRRLDPPCARGAVICVGEGRFRAQVDWRVPSTDQSGSGTPLSLGGDSGSFWFFSPTNAELVVKVLDGRSINDAFWVFYGSLTDVEFDLTVTDTQTGAMKTYHNAAGRMASVGDTGAFPQASAPAAAGLAGGQEAGVVAPDESGCGGETLCLGGRYSASVSWQAAGAAGAGQAAPLSRDSGTFSFFGPGNVELIVKVLDGRALNGKVWVFYGSLTDVEFDLTVRDTLTGVEKTYHNPPGHMASIGDTNAF